MDRETQDAGMEVFLPPSLRELYKQRKKECPDLEFLASSALCQIQAR